MSHLLLVRHGKSLWNEKGLWTGQTEVSLHEDGRKEARRAGEAIRDIHIHHVYVSPMERTRETFFEIKQVLGRDDLEAQVHDALLERHYGIYTGKNKWEIKEKIGEEKFHRVRRGWDEPIPEGETLKDVHSRVIPYFKNEIEVTLRKGKNVLVVSHGNTIRALVKYLEDLDELAIEEVEIGTGEVHCYEINSEGRVLRKEIRGRSVGV